MSTRNVLFSCFLLISFAMTRAQGDFHLPGASVEKAVVPFRLVNNMIVIDARLNEKELTFLVDTGIKKTILFNVKLSDSLLLKNVEELELRGLGEGDALTAVSSSGNLFRCHGIVNPSLSLFMIRDNLFDLSAKMGIDVHGIIGGDLFEDFVVKINYSSQKMTFYEPENYTYPKCKS